MTTTYNFEWNLQKARINLEKHGISFEEAATIFKDSSALTIFDPDHSQDEDRWITLGISGKGRLIVVNHTYQEEQNKSGRIRIISSRRATKRETKNYGEVS